MSIIIKHGPVKVGEIIFFRKEIARESHGKERSE
jgi:ribosomal protein S28E/S33